MVCGKISSLFNAKVLLLLLLLQPYKSWCYNNKNNNDRGIISPVLNIVKATEDTTTIIPSSSSSSSPVITTTTTAAAAFVVGNQTSIGKGVRYVSKKTTTTTAAFHPSFSSSYSFAPSSLLKTTTSSSLSLSKLSSTKLFGTRRRRRRHRRGLNKGHVEPFAPQSTTTKQAFSSSSSLYQSTNQEEQPGEEGEENDQNSNDISNELPKNFPRRNDAMAAITAVRKACAITRQIQPLHGSSSSSSSATKSEKQKDEITTVTKADLSPVTVGDFASQAVILHHLHSIFPKDRFIAEESSEALREDEDLAECIWEAICLQAHVALSMDDDDGEDDDNKKEQQQQMIQSIEELMESIDLGQTYNKDGSAKHDNDNDEEEEGQSYSKKTTKRVWCLDPIDGTKGFLRGKLDGGQYAVALALLEDGKPTIGILGCPNLPVSTNDDQYEWSENETEDNNLHSRGCIFVASKGGGCYQLPLFPKNNNNKKEVEEENVVRVWKKIEVTPNDGSGRGVDRTRFCVGVERSIADALGQANAIATTLHGPNAIDPSTDSIIQSRRMDSQAKYAVLARGGAEIYLRLPKPGYVEWIWDHAAGSVVITEAGGQMTDVDGNDIDFSLGAKLSPKVKGIVGTNGGEVHEAVLNAYRELVTGEE